MGEAVRPEGRGQLADCGLQDRRAGASCLQGRRAHRPVVGGRWGSGPNAEELLTRPGKAWAASLARPGQLLVPHTNTGRSFQLEAQPTPFCGGRAFHDSHP